MRLYVEVAKRAFRRFSTYRGATLAGLFTNTVFGFLQAYVLLAVFRERDEINGFDATDAVTFIFVTQGFLMMVGAFGASEISERIRTGDVVTDLYRPVDFQAYWLAHDLGRGSFHALARGIPPVLVGALAFDLRLPPDVVTASTFVIACVLAIGVSFAIRFLVSLTTFWILDERGPAQLAAVVAMFMSGFIVPLQLFPDWLREVARVLPWAAYVQLPVEVFLGKHQGMGLVGVVALQVAWLAVLLIAGRALLAAATRKVVVQGG